MTSIQDISSGYVTAVYDESRTFVEPLETIGNPSDAAATDVAVENSMFALGKGICAALGIATGSGDAVVNTTPDVYVDLGITLGDRSDAPATDTGTHSAIAFLKGILAKSGI